MKSIKKVISLIIAIALIASTVCTFAQEDEIMLISEAPSDAAASSSTATVENAQTILSVEFADMDSNHFAHDATANLYKNGFVSGDETGTIRPEQAITREETVKLALSINKVTVEENLAVDAPDSSVISDWAKDIVATAYKYGVLRGDETGEIRPQGIVTRAEMVAIVIRALNVQVAQAAAEFTDVANDAWYAKDIAAASELGLVNGYEDGSFKPENTITRAEAFVIFNRVYTLRTALENAAK